MLTEERFLELFGKQHPFQIFTVPSCVPTGREPRIKRFVCLCEVCGKLWNSWEKQMLCSPKCRKTYYSHD